MKQKFRDFKNSKCAFALMVFVFLSCQIDDKQIDVNTVIESVHQKTIKTVAASEIPEVINFLKKANNNTLDFSISRNSEPGVILDTREPDLILTDLETQQIKTLTGASGQTNYTFELKLQNAPTYPDKVSFFNLIVKEINTAEGFYGYIQEFRVDKQWYLNNDISHDMSGYTGKMIFYNLDGYYLAKAELNNGSILESDTRHPCNDPVNGGGSGGGSGGSGSGGSGSSGGSSGGSNGGTVGCSLDFEFYQENCNCGCNDPCTITIVIITDCDIDISIRDLIRTPCDEAPLECNEPNLEPCECAEDGASCVIEEDEVIITIPITPCQKLNFMSQNQDFMGKINELNTLSNALPTEPRFEKGYVLEGALANTTYTPVEGIENLPELENIHLTAGSAINGFIHNHFFINEIGNNGQPIQSLSIFSDVDVFSLYTWDKNGNIVNTNGFTYVVVYKGDMYHLQIENLQDFIDFGDSFLLNDTGDGITDFLFDIMNDPSEGNVRHPLGKDINRNNFAKMLNLISNLNPGISLYHSKVNNPVWKKVTVGANHTINLQECN